MTDAATGGRAEDPGVPEALPQALNALRQRLGPATMDRLWIFPPLRRGRTERGLVAASLFLDGEERRRVVTLSYAAERSGRDLTVEPSFTDEGDAPPELLPRVMEGVVRRAGEDHRDAREVEVAGDAEVFQRLVEELEAAVVEAELS